VGPSEFLQGNLQNIKCYGSYVATMVNVDRIIENRKYSNSNFYTSFKKKVTLAFELERRIEENKFSKESIKQARRQYIVFLVSCLESYLEEIFKRYIDSNFVNFEKLFKMKGVKQLKLNLSDLLNFERKNVKISEVVIEYLNFQNVECIVNFCNIIEFNKYASKLKKSIKNNLSKDDTTQLSKDFIKIVSKQRNQSFDNLKVSKMMSKTIIEYMASDHILLELFSAQKCMSTISQYVQKRHRIVHKAANVDVENWEVSAFTLAIIQFSTILFKMYQFRKNKSSLF